MTFETPFTYVHRAGTTTKRPLLLLHGTGGNEHDLLGLADSVVDVGEGGFECHAPHIGGNEL